MLDLNTLVRPNILGLVGYSSARDEFKGSQGVFLDANENPFGALNRYPDPYQTELKSMISKQFNQDSDQIFIGNGSDEIIDLVFRVFCNPGVDKALTFTPTYGMYQVSADINNVDLTRQNLTKEFQIDFEKLQPELKNPNLKLIIACSPNNPTGNLLSSRSIENVLKHFNGILLLDEAYIDFADSDSLSPLIEAYPNLIVMRTLSKAWGLAGARIGFAFADKQIVNLLNKIKSPYNISEPNQAAAVNALSDPSGFESNLEIILNEREVLRKSLLKMDQVRRVYPSNANFLLVEVDDANRIYERLISRNIIVRKRSDHVKNCIRVSVGSPSENNQIINVLKELEA